MSLAGAYFTAPQLEKNIGIANSVVTNSKARPRIRGRGGLDAIGHPQHVEIAIEARGGEFK
jgi:hypothetical protein